MALPLACRQPQPSYRPDRKAGSTSTSPIGGGFSGFERAAAGKVSPSPFSKPNSSLSEAGRMLVLSCELRQDGPDNIIGHLG